MTHKQPVLLTSIRDVKVYKRLSPDMDIIANLRGIITRVTSRGGIIFFVLHDGTDSIQIIANKETFYDDNWKKISAIKASSRINVKAPVGYSNRGRISLILEGMSSLEIEHQISIPMPQSENVSVQILLAHLRDLAGAFLKKKGFIEIEPNFISTYWDITGLHPLRVDYPGFGISAYLVPSPAPQLLKAVITSGNNKIFCISRCFTLTYREYNVGAESIILSAKMLMSKFQDTINLAREATKHILRYTATSSEINDILNSEWPVRSLEWPPDPAIIEISGPEIYVSDRVAPFDSIHSERKVNLFQIYWPPNVMLVEGFSELLGNDVPIGSFTIHLECLLKLLTPIETRRLQDQCKIEVEFSKKGPLYDNSNI